MLKNENTQQSNLNWEPHQTQPETDLWRGFWRLADPKITLASMASILLGTCAAAADGPLNWGWLLVTVLAYFFIEGAKNASGDLADYQGDTQVPEADRTVFSGGKRVLVDGILTPKQTLWIAVVLYVLALILGAAIVLLREPDVFWLGLIGAILAFSYNAPPLKLAYHGLGELSCVISYGPLIALSAYMIQRQTLNLDVLWLSLPLGLLIGSFLWVNEFPDYEADKAVGKRNLVVRLGKERASQAFVMIVAMAFVLLFALPLLTALPFTTWFGLLALIPSGYAAYQLLQQPHNFHRHVPVQPAVLLSFVTYAVAVGVGLIIAA